ncbi:Integral membrane protein [Cocos nucifera]|uniref:Integral membrane protein n=1 Tax=Cocos nucifera TaxID=13894 RepID=A0A8K0MYQ0_COCNU|nr:Integral membrane protein [Cocos nucifera]
MVRFVLSAIPFIPFVLQAHQDCNTRSAGIELGLWVSLGYLSQALALLTSDAGRASFISAFTVIVVPLIDGMFGATIPAFIWYGAFVSLIGVAMLECGGSPPCVGDALNILSSVFFGIHMLRTEQISRSTKKENFLALLGYEVCVMALSSVILFLVRGIFSDVHHPNLGSCDGSILWDCIISFPWIPAIYTGIFSTGLCLWAELDAMGDVSATEAAIIYGLEPVWGAAFAWFLLGERWGTTEWIGAALVLCGSLAVQILGSTSEKSKKIEDSSNSNCLEAADKQNNLSFSAVLVNSRKNVADPFQKTNYDTGHFSFMANQNYRGLKVS